MSAPSARFFRRAGAGALAGLMLVTAAACTPPVDLNKEPGMVGQIRHEQIYQGSMAETDGVKVQPDGTVLIIPGSVIQAEKAYQFEGELRIQGNLPADCNIEVQGRVLVEGDVGPGCKITARAPMASESYMTLQPRYNPMTKMTDTVPVTRSRDTGPLYPEDTRPAITVGGTVGAKARLDSNHGVAMRHADPTARIEHGDHGPGLQVSGGATAQFLATMPARAPTAMRPG